MIGTLVAYFTTVRASLTVNFIVEKIKKKERISL